MFVILFFIRYHEGMRYLLLLPLLLSATFDPYGLEDGASDGVYQTEERYYRHSSRRDEHRSQNDPLYDRMADTYDARARRRAIQLREMEEAEDRAYRAELRQERLERARIKDRRERRIKSYDRRTKREEMIGRMVKRSWHDLPHSNTSSPVKRQYLYPYKQGRYPLDDYSSDR